MAKHEPEIAVGMGCILSPIAMVLGGCVGRGVGLIFNRGWPIAIGWGLVSAVTAVFLASFLYWKYDA